MTAVGACPRDPIGGFDVGVWRAEPAYGWCAYASKRLAPNFFIARRNTTGETDGRLVVGLLLPRGAVTPHATFPPFIEWIPWTTALQMPA